MTRLQQDFESEIKSYGFYTIEPNLVLAKETNKEEIIAIIERLHQQGYFSEIKPIYNIEFENLKRIK